MTQPIRRMTAQCWRITATLLLALLCEAMVAPGMSFDDGLEGSVPACCRAHGRHQCSLKLRHEAAEKSNSTSFAQLSERCPYAPPSLAPAHSGALHPLLSALIYSEAVAHPASRQQTEAKHRIAFDRSRQKRGPPAQHLSPKEK